MSALSVPCQIVSSPAHSPVKRSMVGSWDGLGPEHGDVQAVPAEPKLGRVAERAFDFLAAAEEDRNRAYDAVAIACNLMHDGEGAIAIGAELGEGTRRAAGTSTTSILSKWTRRAAWPLPRRSGSPTTPARPAARCRPPCNPCQAATMAAPEPAWCLRRAARRHHHDPETISRCPPAVIYPSLSSGLSGRRAAGGSRGRHRMSAAGPGVRHASPAAQATPRSARTSCRIFGACPRACCAAPG